MIIMDEQNRGFVDIDTDTGTDIADVNPHHSPSSGRETEIEMQDGINAVNTNPLNAIDRKSVV